jgi:hypothetical protein
VPQLKFELSTPKYKPGTLLAATPSGSVSRAKNKIKGEITILYGTKSKEVRPFFRNQYLLSRSINSELYGTRRFINVLIRAYLSSLS